MSTDIKSRLRRAFIANGGTEEEFETVKAELVARYRRQAVVNEVLEEGNRRLSMNDLIRGQVRNGPDDGLLRFLAKPKDNPDVA